MQRMQFLPPLVFFILWFCTSQAISAPTLPLELPGHVTVAYDVYDVDTHKTLYARRPNERFTPASITKVLSGLAAYKKLGPDYRYTTTLYGNIKGSVAKQVGLRFTGDPSLTSAQVTSLLMTLSQRQVKRIQGDIHIDAAAFSPVIPPLGWTVDALPYCYGNPTPALSIDQNCATVTIVQQGKSYAIKQVQAPTPLNVISHLSVASGKAAHLCRLHIAQQAPDRITLTGCLPPRHSWQLRLAMPSARYIIQSQLKQFFKAHHITFSGQVVYGPILGDKLAHVESPKLGKLIAHALKTSDNQYSDAFIRTLGKHMLQHGNFKAGVAAMRQAIDLPDAALFEDGSGGSRYNLISARTLVNVLRHAQKDPALFRYLETALPHYGEPNTTLANRTAPHFLGNHVFAKTGTLITGANLAGYLRTHNGHTLVFAIFVQGTTDIQLAQEIQTAFLRALY